MSPNNIPPQSTSEIQILPHSQTTQRSSEDNLLPLGEFSVDLTALTLQDIRAIESCVGELEDLTMCKWNIFQQVSRFYYIFIFL